MNRSAKAIRIGVIGTGNIARQVHLPVLTSMPGVQVTWVADVNAASAASVAHAFKLRAVALPLRSGPESDCDVVLVASPVGARLPYLEHLAGRGIAAFVEKPFARTVEEHRSFSSLFPAHRIGCGFMRRAFDTTLTVKRILSEGWLGRPTRIVVREGGRIHGSGVDRSYFDDDRLGGGVLMELGCHAIDFAMHITGATTYRIVQQQFAFDGSPDRAAKGEVRLFDDAGYAQGLPLEYHFSWIDDLENGAEIHFPAARLVVGTKPETSVRLTGPAPGDGEHEPRDSGVGLEPAHLGATTTNQAFYLQWLDFLDGLDGERPSRFLAESALPVTALIADLYRMGRGV